MYVKRGRDVKRDKGGRGGEEKREREIRESKDPPFLRVYYQGGGGLKRANISRERQLAYVGRSARYSERWYKVRVRPSPGSLVKTTLPCDKYLMSSDARSHCYGWSHSIAFVSRTGQLRVVCSSEHLLLSFSYATVSATVGYWFQFRDRSLRNISISRKITPGLT